MPCNHRIPHRVAGAAVFSHLRHGVVLFSMPHLHIGGCWSLAPSSPAPSLGVLPLPLGRVPISPLEALPSLRGRLVLPWGCLAPDSVPDPRAYSTLGGAVHRVSMGCGVVFRRAVSARLAVHAVALVSALVAAHGMTWKRVIKAFHPATITRRGLSACMASAHVRRRVSVVGAALCLLSCGAFPAFRLFPRC